MDGATSSHQSINQASLWSSSSASGAACYEMGFHFPLVLCFRVTGSSNRASSPPAFQSDRKDVIACSLHPSVAFEWNKCGVTGCIRWWNASIVSVARLENDRLSEPAASFNNEQTLPPATVVVWYPYRTFNGKSITHCPVSNLRVCTTFIWLSLLFFRTDQNWLCPGTFSETKPNRARGCRSANWSSPNPNPHPFVDIVVRSCLSIWTSAANTPILNM